MRCSPIDASVIAAAARVAQGAGADLAGRDPSIGESGTAKGAAQRGRIGAALAVYAAATLFAAAASEAMLTAWPLFLLLHFHWGASQVSVLLCTVTFYANRAHNLTRSP